MGATPAEPIVTRGLSAADRPKVQALLIKVTRADGFAPLSDQLVADLHDTRLRGRGAPVTVVLRDRDSASLGGYAQASHRDDRWTMQLVIDPARRDVGGQAESVLVTSTLDAISAVDGGTVDWWVYDAGPPADRLAAAHGFRADRDLLQMRRPLPAARRSGVTTRSFVVGRDESGWLDVNNRSFAGHAEQGGWTTDTLHRRLAQPWFDADGLRLHERDGRLAAFCWTKIHPDRSGEIYVIGVDPDFQGQGLGKELTLAGLDHLADAGIEQAMLYVAGENLAAVGLYDRLGFEVHRTERAYQREL